MRTEVKISGLGGQGVVLASVILGHAAIIDGKYATQTRSYGAEARGTAAWGDVIISDGSIAYPMTIKCDILVAMSQQAVGKYINILKDGGTLIVDDSLVKEIPSGSYKIYKIPATTLAEEIGRKIFANMVMLGFLVGTTKMLSSRSVEKAVLENVPEERDKNVEAVKLGLAKARELR